MKEKPGAVIALLALVGAGGIFLAAHSFDGDLTLPRLPGLGRECTVRADGEVALDATQMANAATIAAVGVRRKMPERAVVIALATAFQESRLENLDTGDRDSVGLFQQRPSQGWGTPERIQDPRYATDRFYTALKKVKHWKTMRVTEAAQRVQRSAYPNAYERWADDSAVLAKALLGRAVGAVACTVSGKPAMRGSTATAALVDGMRLDWGKGFGNPAPTQPSALTLPVPDGPAGWRYAHWLVSHANQNGVQQVRFANLQWRAADGKWTPLPADGVTNNTQVVATVFA